MPVNASDLIKDRSAPVTVKLDDPVQKALELMVSQDFSQLPIVDEDNKPKGMVSADSILSGLANFGVTVEKLRVRDVARKHRAYSFDTGIFDLLESLYNNSSVLITDSDGRLVGIVTDWDTADYFRQRAEDMLLIEDIETALKEHIDAAFHDGMTATRDDKALQEATVDVSTAFTISVAEESIRKYQVAAVNGSGKLEPKQFEVVREHYRSKFKGDVNDLTLYQLAELMTHKKRWNAYGQNFSLDDKALRQLLKSVADIRNKIAHFREELTPAERNTLKFCATWFEQNEPTYPKADATPTTDTSESLSSEEPSGAPDIVPAGEVIGTGESRYSRLAASLQSQSAPRLQLSLTEIEAIIGGELPPSARTHRSWWANDSVSHVQSQEWLDAGWRVAGVNLSEGVITFARLKERESLYIDFFSQLANDLRQKNAFPVKDTSPDGSSWHTVGSFRNDEGRAIGTLTASFARKGRFRVEFYIDSGEEAKNNEVYALLQSDSPSLNLEGARSETSLETTPVPADTINWEPLEQRRASRLAIYHPGSITDSESRLSELRKWAVVTMMKFQPALEATLAPHGYRYTV